MPETRFTVSLIFRVLGTRIFPGNFPDLLPLGVVIFVRPYEFFNHVNKFNLAKNSYLSDHKSTTVVGKNLLPSNESTQCPIYPWLGPGRVNGRFHLDNFKLGEIFRLLIP
jgi:hypothetical protein